MRLGKDGAWRRETGLALTARGEPACGRALAVSDVFAFYVCAPWAGPRGASARASAIFQASPQSLSGKRGEGKQSAKAGNAKGGEKSGFPRIPPPIKRPLKHTSLLPPSGIIPGARAVLGPTPQHSEESAVPGTSLLVHGPLSRGSEPQKRWAPGVGFLPTRAASPCVEVRPAAVGSSRPLSGHKAGL